MPFYMNCEPVITALAFLLCCSCLSAQDAPYPVSGTDPWSTADASRETGATRDRICLNGYWRFWPSGGELPQPDAGWCWQKVPGSWPASHRWGLFPYPFVPAMSTYWAEKLPVDIHRGNWHSKNNKSGEPIPFDAVEKAWYQREWTVPSDWEGRRILLSAEFVERRADAYVNGEHIGKILWPHGELDITPYVTPGAPATISMIVSATASGVRGLAGDVYVEARPTGVWLDEVYLVPSVRDETLTIRAAVRNGDTNTTYRLAGSAELDGRPVFEFSPQPAQRREDSLTLTVPWKDAAKWDFDHPRLHRIRIRLLAEDGALLDETLPITMGFREFGIQGRAFVLNGTPVHFRPTFYKPIGASTGLADPQTVERVVRRLRRQGYNLLVSSIYTSGPAVLHYPRQFLETCDRLGMAVQLQLNKATQFMNYNKEEKRWELPPEGLAQWKEAVRPQIVRQRQHPSLFFWAANANIFAGPEKANPRGWIREERPKQRMPEWDIFSRILEVSDDHIRAMDGERPIITLGNGNYRDVISTYVYPNFHARQELRELPSLWAREGKKPVMIAEWGNPADISFSSHRDNKPRWPAPESHAEPMPAEYSAVFDGDQAYNLDAAGVSLYQRLDQLHEQPFSIYHWTRQHAVRFGMHQSFFKTKIDSIHEVLPTWRAWGISSVGILEPYTYRQISAAESDHWENPESMRDLKTPGVKPDYHVWYEAALTHPEADRFFELTAHGKAFKEMAQPALSFIGGHPDQEGGIANRCANVYAGQPVRCSLIAVNDALRDQTATAEWRWSRNGHALGKGSAQWDVKAGQRHIHPLTLKAPAEAGELKLDVQFSCNNEIWREERTWQVYPSVTTPSLQGVVLYDPGNTTAPDFQRLKVPFVPVTNTNNLPDQARVLVIGQEALKPETPLPVIREADARGINILVLAQDEEAVSKRLGFRYADVGTRRLTLRRPADGVLKGIRGKALSDWAGAATMGEPYPDMTTKYHYAHPQVDWLGFKNNRFYRWGNTGTVGTVLPEKPVIAGFEILVDGQVDMNYMGLCRTRGRKAVVTLCQLDLCARTEPDPVADRLLINLLESGLAFKAPAPTPCVFLGAKAGAWARKVGVTATPVTTLDELPDNGILIAGPDAEKLLENPMILQRVQQGLRVLAVGWEGEALSALTGSTITTEPRELVYEPPLVNPPAPLAGLGPADLFWHGPLACHPIVAIHEEKVATQDVSTFWTPFGSLAYVKRGFGEVVCLQPTPDDVVHAWQPRARNKILRVMATILTHWSAPLEGVRMIDDLADPPEEGAERWNAGYYSRSAKATDDPLRWHSW